MKRAYTKKYREWILAPVLVAIDMPGFIHHEMAVQACVSIESTNDVTAYIVSINESYIIALENPTDFECECAKIAIEHLLKVDRSI